MANFFENIWKGIVSAYNKIMSVNEQQNEIDRKVRQDQINILTGDKKTLNNLGEELTEVGKSFGTESIYGESIGQAIQDAGNNLQNATKTEDIIEDKTNENQEVQIGQQTNEDLLKLMDEWQKEQWEREDQIRQETQEREDTAWQRSVADMRKAGINPNLINAAPAASGGGITQATGKESGLLSQDMRDEISKLELMLDQEFKADENQKDRLSQIISSIISIAGLAMLKK